MLKQRVITAAVLLAVLLVTLSVSTPWPFLILLSVTAGCALWEWLRLSLLPDNSRLAAPAGCVLAVVFIFVSGQLLKTDPHSSFASVIASLNQVGMPLVSVVWVTGLIAAVLQAHTESRRHPVALSVFGIVAVAALWLALAQFFILYGAWFLVSMMALIWVADTTAYFVGKAFGRHKLAPRVSPGKTWQGAFGGVVGAMLWMAVSAQWEGSFADVLVNRWSFIAMILFSAILASLSILGDLFESLLKRRAGVKDSSQLLPGHGGVYDRIDALFPVAPVALVLVGV